SALEVRESRGCLWSVLAAGRRGRSRGMSGYGGRSQLITQFAGFARQAFDQAQSIDLFVGGHLLTHVVLAVLQQAIVAAGDLACRGYYGLASPRARLN